MKEWVAFVPVVKENPKKTMMAHNSSLVYELGEFEFCYIYLVQCSPFMVHLIITQDLDISRSPDKCA